VVRGEKQTESERTEGRYNVTECVYNRFERAIQLPDEVETGKAHVIFKRGVLRMELPKACREPMTQAATPANLLNVTFQGQFSQYFNPHR